MLSVLAIAAAAAASACDRQDTICDEAKRICRQCRDGEDLETCLRTAEACTELPDIEDTREACCRQFMDTISESCD